MVITWLGSLAVLIRLQWCQNYKPTRFEFNTQDTIKRIGVYYMCIDDLMI